MSQSNAIHEPNTEEAFRVSAADPASNPWRSNAALYGAARSFCVPVNRAPAFARTRHCVVPAPSARVRSGSPSRECFHEPLDGSSAPWHGGTRQYPPRYPLLKGLPVKCCESIMEHGPQPNPQGWQQLGWRHRSATGSKRSVSMSSDAHDHMTAVDTFYSTLAPWYHMIFEDWDASIARQGRRLNAIVLECWGARPHRILDVAVGIGTQTIALAQHGHSLIGSDIARGALSRAQRELQLRNLDASLVAADMAEIPLGRRTVDVIICCDNSLPHLLSTAHIEQALTGWLDCVRPGGGVVISMRDYGTAKPVGTVEEHPYGDHVLDGVRYVLRQVWTWEEDRQYTLRLEIRQAETNELQVGPEVRYFAISPAEVGALAWRVGFADVRVETGWFYQPIVIGYRAS